MIRDVLIVGSGLALGVWFLSVGLRAAWEEFRLRRPRPLREGASRGHRE